MTWEEVIMGKRKAKAETTGTALACGSCKMFNGELAPDEDGVGYCGLHDVPIEAGAEACEEHSPRAADDSKVVPFPEPAADAAPEVEPQAEPEADGQEPATEEPAADPGLETDEEVEAAIGAMPGMVSMTPAKADAYVELAKLEGRRRRLEESITNAKAEHKDTMKRLEGALSEVENRIDQLLVGLDSGTFDGRLPYVQEPRTPVINPEQASRSTSPTQECRNCECYRTQPDTDASGACERHDSTVSPGDRCEHWAPRQESEAKPESEPEPEKAHACGSCIEYDGIEGEPDRGYCDQHAKRVERTEPACEDWESALAYEEEDVPLDDEEDDAPLDHEVEP